MTAALASIGRAWSRLASSDLASSGRASISLANGLASIALGLLTATSAHARPVTVADLLAEARAQDWRSPDPDDTLYLDLPSGRVVIELAARIAPLHVANIKTLARAHYFDGLAIVRVQDNYVVQWADPEHKRPVPEGVHLVAPEFTAAPGSSRRFEPLPDGDLYAAQVGFLDGFPAGRDPSSGTVWLAHCYGMVGVGRDDPPESDGTEMYAVIGHAPRQLDRNVALVGRVLKGMELLSSLPRGSGEMGFYVGAEKDVPIVSMRIASDLPPAERTPVEVLRTESPVFRAVLEQRRNRREAWFKFNPGHIDLCNVPLPVRPPSPASK
ncbi:MAG TPA: peptidylprolyl isomerase [Steroidobacteraceae bacterium]|nr:peptidylprolyl isomerase [Steroidobacteraceae bacterium]